MSEISHWAASANHDLQNKLGKSVCSYRAGIFGYEIFLSPGSLWITATWPAGGYVAFRAAFAPAGDLTLTANSRRGNKFDIRLRTAAGNYVVKITLPDAEGGILKYTTSFVPLHNLVIPFWPRDIFIPWKGDKPDGVTGKIHVTQEGARTGMAYFSITRPKAGSVMYMQNLTALAGYCDETNTSCSNVVGGQWPELGFALPPATNKPLPAGKEFIISDALVALTTAAPDNEAALTHQYLDMLASLYMELPKPETKYHNWPETLNKGLKDLLESPGCWSQVAGNIYFNAYVCDYDTPPEVMVQLAVLLPLLDYTEWSGEQLDVIDKIKKGLPPFYDEKLKTLVRWHPAAKDQLTGDEEQKNANVMDSWYLHHPLLNLSRMALKGDKQAEKLFFDSLEYCIKVAHHFKYDWPVFYQMETLETIKAETATGEGGEQDVAGLYAHVMLQAFELSKQNRYLHEAERAAKTLQGKGFALMYQANNTSFGAGAMLRLFRITKKKLYLDLSYLLLANLFKNMRMWDCQYGYGKNYPNFFCIFPLSNAPYTAVFEEQEVFCALHDFVQHATGIEILPSARLLISEFIRYMIHRAAYYYPPMLPAEMLSAKIKVGELDAKLWIALEDLHEGWEQSGQVGQEVYGAGNAFGILPRTYFKVPGEDFMLSIDYPVSGFEAKGSHASFKIEGDGRLNCRMAILKGKNKLPEFTVTESVSKKNISPRKAAGRLEYSLTGDAAVKVSWKK